LYYDINNLKYGVMAKINQGVRFDEELERDLRMILEVRNDARGEKVGYSPFVEEICRGYVDSVLNRVSELKVIKEE